MRLNLWACTLLYAVLMRFLVAVYKFSNKVNGLFISIAIKNFYASCYVKVDKSTVHLVDEFNDYTEWPNRDGRFDLRSFPDGSYIKVEGSAGLASLSSSTPNPSSSQSRNYSQLFRYYNMIQLFEWLKGLACSSVVVCTG